MAYLTEREVAEWMLSRERRCRREAREALMFGLALGAIALIVGGLVVFAHLRDAGIG